MAGRMDEIRIWAVARAAEQIRDGMYQRVRGDEEGLVAAWSFDGGTARDLTPNGFHLQLHGDVRIVEEAFPDRSQTRPLLAIFGKVANEKEGPLAGATVTVERDGLVPRTATANLRGEYRLLVEPSELPCRLTASHRTLNLILTNLVVSAGDTNVNLTLREFAQLSGRIAAFDGTPLEAVVVQAVQQFEGTLLEASSEPGFTAEFFAMDNRLRDFPEIPATRAPSIRTNQLRVAFPLQLTGGPFLPGTSLRDNFYARWTGKFRVPESGEYIFAVRSDDGARLFIDGSLVANNGTVHYFVWGTGATNLNSGEHDLKLEYFNAGGGTQVVGVTNVTYCDVQNGFAGTGNIAVNPIFQSTSDLIIVPGSLCIDKGSTNAAYNDVYFPPSLGSSRNDMGAHGGSGAGARLRVEAWPQVAVFFLGGVPGYNYQIQASADLSNWQTVKQVQIAHLGDYASFLEPGANNPPYRFYRLNVGQ